MRLIRDRLARSGFHVRPAGNPATNKVPAHSKGGWIVRSSTYVALTVHAASVDVSKELSIQHHLSANSKDSTSNLAIILLDPFMLEGSNGKHPCFVTEPMENGTDGVFQRLTTLVPSKVYVLGNGRVGRCRKRKRGPGRQCPPVVGFNSAVFLKRGKAYSLLRYTIWRACPTYCVICTYSGYYALPKTYLLGAFCG